jgi:hypothetical protein
MIIFQPWSKIKSYVHYKPIAAGYPDNNNAFGTVQ